MGKKALRFILIVCFAFLMPSGNVYADEQPVIVVIDPGHSGENLGAQCDGYVEKELNMVVANAMKEELEKYDNVVVYLTHETDIDMTIKNRALFAKEKNADFLFCLHFNSSVNHNLYGAEVWVPAYGNLYVAGRQFAEIEMEQLTNMGLYSRGIKTRLNDDDEDYYGILRYCSELNIPSALIEHCHLDHDNDRGFYQNSEEKLKAFGRADAEAAAKYLGLSSVEKGVDYSDYPKVEIESSSEAVRPDKSEPDECRIEIVSIDEEKGEITVNMKAADYDSYILYYNYSLDGGNTYSELCSWPRPEWDSSEPELTFTVAVPFDKDIELRTNAYNGFDVWKESNILNIPAIPEPQEETMEEEAVYEEIYPEMIYEPVSGNEMNQGEKIQLIVLILLISLLMSIVLFAMVKMIFRLKGNSKEQKEQ